MKFANLNPDKQVGNYKWNHQALLGAGAFGKVYLGKDQNNKRVAIKVMNNSELSDPYLQKALKNEVKILQMLKGVNTCGIIDFLQTKNNTYIIQPFADGGDLRGYLNKNGKINEKEAIKIMSQLLSGYKELVQNNLIHRDLKPENSLINEGVNMLADFGFGKVVDNYNNAKLTTGCGTPCYMAPQLLKGETYSTKSDIWSMGIIYFEILYGTLPWQFKTMDDIVKLTSQQPVRFPSQPLVSNQSKNFIKGCLQPVERQRFTWDQVFNHQIWNGMVLIDDKTKQVKISNEQGNVIKKLQDIVVKQKLDVEVIFKNFDKSGNKQLDLVEFFHLLQVVDQTIKQSESDNLFNQLDVDSSGNISFEEFKQFILETDYQPIEVNFLLQEQKAKRCLKKLITVINEHEIDVYALIKKYDKSGDNHIDNQEFWKILNKVDDTLTIQESNIIFGIFDNDKSGTISTQEFLKQVKPQNFSSIEKELNNLKLQKDCSEQSKKTIVALKQTVQKYNIDIRQLFSQFDKDKSGSLDKQEFAQFIKCIRNVSSEEAFEIFQYFNTDGGKTIEIDEFLKIFA